MILPDWRKIQKENFTSVEELLKYLEISPSFRKKILYHPRFPLNVPRRLASKIEKNRLDDPIFLQFVPLIEEELVVEGFVKEPLEDQQFLKTKKLLQKYKGRALVLVSSACAMSCRFCFRQNFPYEPVADFEAEIEHIAQDSSLSEVILSGGDPLALSDLSLSNIFSALEGISHVKRIRLHSRFPVGIPERIDESFLSVLAKSSKQIFFVVHCNHPRELDPEVIAALHKIQKLNIPILNQTVLLKGVNDLPETLLALSEALVNGGILPYYLHALDPVEGASHFSLPTKRGVQLIRYVQEHTSGFAVPRFVRETPNCPSKTWLYTQMT
jgi:EF-P beta-lysylation protein EpmB